MLKLLLIAMATFNLNAQEPIQEEVTPAATEQETRDVLAAQKTVDYKAQMGKLTPTLGDRNINEVENPWTAYIKNTEGNVLVKRHDAKGNIIIAFAPLEGTLLRSRDLIDIEANGRAELEFKDSKTLNLGPSTLIRIEKQDTCTLLLGSMRVRAKETKEGNNIFVYAPNVFITTHPKSDLAIRYDGSEKKSQVACFDGTLNANGIRDSKELTGFDRTISGGETINVVTTYEKGRETYLPTETEKLSLESKKELLESFYTDPSQVDSWEYTRISTSFLRFAPTLEYATFNELTDTKYFNFTLGYIPLIYLGSIFYLEPYFYVSFANPFDQLFYRVGGSLQINPFFGAYVGLGGGVFWIHKDTTNYGGDFAFNIGYTFAEKLLSFIDGFRFSYFVSNASGLHERAYMFSLVVNIGRGRELY